MALALSLCALVGLGILGEYPEVDISDLPGIDSGTTVVITGFLTDLWVYDSGSESLVLCDEETDSVVKVMCTPGVAPMPSTYASIGDELRIVGDLSSNLNPPTMFSSGDGISLVRKSTEAMTLDLLSSHWGLFEGDRLTVCGVLVECGEPPVWKLFNEEGTRSVPLSFSEPTPDGLTGREVEVVAILKLDQSTMSMYLQVHSINLSHG
jgi:hypothetical protein